MTAIIASLSGLTPEWDIIRPCVTPGLAVYGNDARGHLASLIPADCQGIVSCGVCGGLDPSLKRGDLVFGDVVLTANGTTFLPDAAWYLSIARRGIPSHHMAAVFSDPHVWATDPTSRAAMFERTHCGIIDNETYAVAALAKERKIPFVVLRAVSDESDDTVINDPAELNPSGTPNLLVDIRDFISDPGTVIHESVGFEQALDTLRNAVTALGPALRFPG